VSTTTEQDLSHLGTEAKRLATRPDAERLQAMRRDRWIDYARANTVLRELERLYETPPRERMPCMLLYGESNIGKTLITRKFEREHPPQFDEARGIEERTIVSMQMPPMPDQARFYAALLFELKAPHADRAPLLVLERLARDLLRRLRPRLLIVDEVHHLLAGSYREQRGSLNLLKYLSNDLKCSVVLVGTDDALTALETDAQMRSRFAPLELPTWRENDDFRRLLAGFERMIPLRRRSNLAERETLQFILGKSGGLTGRVSQILNAAAEIAIADGSERISVASLEEATRGRG
jgi:hypothetical protein